MWDILCTSDIHTNFNQYLTMPSSQFTSSPVDAIFVAGDLTNNGINRTVTELLPARAWLEAMRRQCNDLFWIPGNHDIGLSTIGRQTYFALDSMEYRDYQNYLAERYPWFKPDMLTVQSQFEGGVFAFPATCQAEMHVLPGPLRRLPISENKICQRKLLVIGMPWTPCFNLPHIENQWTMMTASREKDMQLWNRMPCADIVISHGPPFGILDSAWDVFLNRRCLFEKDWIQSMRVSEHLRSARNAMYRNIGSPGLRAYIDNHNPLLVICGHLHESVGLAWYKSTLIVNCAQRVFKMDLAEIIRECLKRREIFKTPGEVKRIERKHGYSLNCAYNFQDLPLETCLIRIPRPHDTSGDPAYDHFYPISEKAKP